MLQGFVQSHTGMRMLVWLHVLQVAGCPILHLQASESLPPLIMTCSFPREAHFSELQAASTPVGAPVQHSERLGIVTFSRPGQGIWTTTHIA